MVRHIIGLAVSCLLLVFGGGCMYVGYGGVQLAAARPIAFAEGGPAAIPMSYTLSRPYVCNNLTIFLVHRGPAESTGGYVPLAEALERGQVKVRETGQVNQLMIHSSAEHDVFVHAGEIVKGGRQDRVVPEDLILSGRSEGEALDAFCVEHGRWTQRGAERPDRFECSPGMLVTPEQRLASRLKGSQSEVWQYVERAQSALRAAIGKPVASEHSPSSLQLTLENEDVSRWAGEYEQTLKSAPGDDSSASGYVAMINGQLSGAEVYSDGRLFASLWPKLLRALAVEAITKLDEPAVGTMGEQDARRALTAAETGRPGWREVNDRTKVVKYETSEAIVFETWDRARPERWAHRSYVIRANSQK